MARDTVVGETPIACANSRIVITLFTRKGVLYAPLRNRLRNGGNAGLARVVNGNPACCLCASAGTLHRFLGYVCPLMVAVARIGAKPVAHILIRLFAFVNRRAEKNLTAGGSTSQTFEEASYNGWPALAILSARRSRASASECAVTVIYLAQQPALQELGARGVLAGNLLGGTA